MQRYPVRATLRKSLGPASIELALREQFGAAERSGDRVTSRFGAIASISVGAERTEVSVDLVMDPKVPDEVARETIARYNRFLEQVTGFSAKERAKRLRKDSAP